MKLLATIHKLKNAEKLLKEADGLVVGLAGFVARETSNLEVEEFRQLANLVKAEKKELYISLKPLLYDEYVNFFDVLFEAIKDVEYTGVIVSDIGYLYLLKFYGVQNIIYNPETLLTNVEDVNSYFDIGVKGTFVSKEINLKDIVKITEGKKGKIYIIAHGHLNMFYSKRKLLKSYFEFIDKPYNYHKTTLKIEELNREGKYPITEDQFGTHIFRDKVSTVIKHLDELKGVDYFLIDSIFKDDEYALEMLKMFRNGYDEDKVKDLQEKYEERWDDGFLNINTIYKKDEESWTTSTSRWFRKIKDSVSIWSGCLFYWWKGIFAKSESI